MAKTPLSRELSLFDLSVSLLEAPFLGSVFISLDFCSLRKTAHTTFVEITSAICLTLH